jgi:hypothetical protein
MEGELDFLKAALSAPRSADAEEEEEEAEGSDAAAATRVVALGAGAVEARCLLTHLAGDYPGGGAGLLCTMQLQLTGIMRGVAELKKRLAADALAAAEAAAAGGAGGGEAETHKRRRATDAPATKELLAKFRTDAWSSMSSKVCKLGAWGGCGAVAFQMNPREEAGRVCGVLGDENFNDAEEGIVLEGIARAFTALKARVAARAAAGSSGAGGGAAAAAALLALPAPPDDAAAAAAGGADAAG